MLTDVMEHYGLARDFLTAEFYETEHHRQLSKEVRAAIVAGRLIGVTGVVGSGKTVMLRRLQEELDKEGKILVSKSLSVDKANTTLPTLIAALFYDLSSDKDPKIPKQGEKRERELQQLIRKGKKPVALFVDEAHDLHGRTLTGLKRLMEVIDDGGGKLSVVLAGHPKLRNDLRRPTMEEIGERSTVFVLEGMAGHQRDYLMWLLKGCARLDVDVADMIEDDAIEMLASRLRTPLQIQHHLTLAFEEAFRVDERPVTARVVESVLSPHIDDLEPTLARHGYRLKDLAEQFDGKPAEFKALFANELEAARATELRERMQAAGLPI